MIFLLPSVRRREAEVKQGVPETTSAISKCAGSGPSTGVFVQYLGFLFPFYLPEGQGNGYQKPRELFSPECWIPTHFVVFHGAGCLWGSSHVPMSGWSAWRKWQGRGA